MSAAEREHAPKIAALIALQERRLSPSAQARIERHLARCADCRQALAAIVLHDRIAEDVREAEPPAIDFSRMELALEREARAVAQQQRARRRRPTLAVAVAIAAAAVIGLALAWPQSGPEVADSRPAPAPRGRDTSRDAERATPELPSAPLAATVTLVAGRGAQVVQSAGGDARAVVIDDVLSDATTLRTDTASEVHVRLAEGAGIVAHAGSELELARLRRSISSEDPSSEDPSSEDPSAGRALDRGEVEIALRSGRVALTSGGPLFTAESRFVVVTSEHRFGLRVTRAEISLDADGTVQLAVAEGEVEVRDPSDRLLEVVRGPARWSSASAAGAPRVGAPHGISGVSDDHEGTAVLHVVHPDLVRWEVGDVAAEGAGELQMRVRAGEVAVAGFDGAGRAFRRVVVVGEDGVEIDDDDLRAEPPRVREGYLPEDDIREVLQRGRVRLRQCYEQGLRERPDLEGRLTVRITVGLDGSVSRARVVGGDVPDGLQQCVRNYAERWMFPPPRGGFVTFDVPLAFEAR